MSRLQPAPHLAQKSMIKPRRRGHRNSPSRTLCAPFLCVARNGFSHIRLHRLSKGRPDSLVNPILLRQPWPGWCVGETQCQRRSHPLPSPFLLWLPVPFGHSDLPMNLPARPARELAEESPACLGPAQVVASPWSCDLALTDAALEHTRMLSFPFFLVWALLLDKAFSVDYLSGCRI